MRSPLVLPACLSGCCVLLLGGCATLNQDECLVSNWEAVGYEDGARGLSAAHVGEHRKACAKHGVALDLAAYNAGRAEGLRTYCQPRNGFNVGASGSAYAGVCPADLDPAFTEAYLEGARLHDLESGVQTAEGELRGKQRALEQLHAELEKKETAVVDGEASTVERLRLLNDIRKLYDRAGEIEAEIALLEREKAEQEERLDTYRASVVYGY